MYTEGNYLGTGTPILTTSPRMTSTSNGLLVSRSSSIYGLKQLGFVRRMESTASSSKATVEIPLV